VPRQAKSQRDIAVLSSTGTVDNIVGNRLAFALEPQEFSTLDNLHNL